jgi:hypothetical protein
MVVLGASGDFEWVELEGAELGAFELEAAFAATGFFTGVAGAFLVKPLGADLPRPVVSPCMAMALLPPPDATRRALPGGAD